MTSIAASGLTVHLSGRRVIADVDMVVDAGVFTVIVGPNGAGKTTMLRTLAGELPPSAGTVLLMGEEPASMSVRHQARLRAFLSQSDRTDVPYPVSTTVGFGTFNSGMAQAERDRLVERRLADLELDQIRDQRVDRLSGGERRRASIARTLVHDAPILLLDEPTDSLDLAHADLVMSLARREAASGRTVVASSHDLNLAARHAERVILMHGGGIIADGPPAQVLTSERLSAVYRCDVIVSLHPIDGGPVIYL